MCSSEALHPEKSMRYKLRFVCVHKGRGGGFKEQEMKKKGRKRGRKDETHYYGYLCNFVTLKWYKLDDKDVDDMNKNDMLLDVRDHICCTTSAMDQRSTMCATRRINLYFLLSRSIIQQYHEVVILLLHQITLIQLQLK
jgi:hypothetical protein